MEAEDGSGREARRFILAFFGYNFFAALERFQPASGCCAGAPLVLLMVYYLRLAQMCYRDHPADVSANNAATDSSPLAAFPAEKSTPAHPGGHDQGLKVR